MRILEKSKKTTQSALDIFRNRPYVKEYKIVDGVKVVSNPITPDTAYVQLGLSRSVRRGTYRKRHRGNNKGHAIVCVGSLRYHKIYQEVLDKLTGKKKVIEHSILKR